MPTQTIKNKATPSKVKTRVSELAKRLETDKQLNEDRSRLQLFLSLANNFDDDLQVNLKLTSFELDDKYATGNPKDWLEFKKYPPVNKYISEYIDEEQLMLAKKSISESALSNTKDAIGVQAMVESKQKTEQNTNVIVFLMPQVNYTKYE